MTREEIMFAYRFEDLLEIADRVGYEHEYMCKDAYNGAIKEHILESIKAGYEWYAIRDFLRNIPSETHNYYFRDDDGDWHPINPYSEIEFLREELIEHCEWCGLITSENSDEHSERMKQKNEIDDITFDEGIKFEELVKIAWGY